MIEHSEAMTKSDFKADSSETPDTPQRTRRHAIFFVLALALTAILAFLLPHGGVSDQFSDLITDQGWPLLLVVVFWLLIVLESLLGLVQAKDAWGARFKRLFLLTVLPVFRLTIATAHPNVQVWLPRYGWLAVSRIQSEAIERRLALPMILITLLILPVIGAELFLQETVEGSALLALTLHTVTALIWFAFVYEFVVLVSLSEKKIDFCKRNWINIAIILLPLISFLSKLQLLRFLRLTKVSKLLRAYRLRGVIARALRLALMMNLIERVMQRNLDKYITHLDAKIAEKQIEIDELKEKRDQAQQKLTDSEAAANSSERTAENQKR